VGAAPLVRPALDGVPETLLWTLHHRAVEARRPNAVLHDPWAVELVGRLEYPFAERFGSGDLGTAQAQALRAACFDAAIRRFLAEHPGATVVALGEGLETQFERVDDGRVRWLGVDLPEVAALRRRLLPDGPRRRTLAGSALDGEWTDQVDASAGVLVTAQGLLMYLRPEQVHALVDRLAALFPGGALLFDTVPRWFSARTLRGRMRTPQGYVAPPMPWGMDARELDAFRAAHPGLADVRRLPLPRGRGLLLRWLLPLAGRLPLARDVRPWVLYATFRPAA
jgi:O-methyltransferase involved in polyketide biosynthesis